MTPAQFLQLIMLGAVWGASFMFTRVAVGEWGTIWLVGLRVLGGALFLMAMAGVLRAAMHWRGELRHYFWLGLVNTALPFALFAYAAHALSASLLSIINSTAPMWGMVIGVLLSRKLPGWREIAGLAIGACGVALLVWRDPSALRAESPLPVLAALLAPLCYGIASHYARRCTAHLPAFDVSLGSMWAAVLCLLPGLLVSPQPAVGSLAAIGAGAWGSALALGVLCTGFAYLIYFKLVREVGAASALTVTFLIPLFGILWGALFLGEAVSAATFAGAACVLLGTAWVTGFRVERMWRRGAADGAR